MKLIFVEPVSGIVRHPVTMQKIENGDRVEFTPAIARLINKGLLLVVAEKSETKPAAKHTEKDTENTEG